MKESKVRLQKTAGFDTISDRLSEGRKRDNGVIATERRQSRCRGERPVTNLDPAVKKETGYIAVWVGALSAVMEAVFLIIGKWDLSVLGGNLGGAAAAIGNFFLMARTVSEALAGGNPKEASTRVKASATVRLLGEAGVCALLIGLLKTNPYATLIPLLFPRIGIGFRPLIDRKRGPAEAKEPEGSDLID